MPATPYSYRSYAGAAAGASLAVTFPFIQRDHVKVYTGYSIGTDLFDSELLPGTDFSWVNDSLISLSTSTLNQIVTIVRKTPTNALITQWTDGSNVDMGDLVLSDQQNLYALQEQTDRTDAAAAASQAALAAVSSVLPYAPVANVAAIPSGTNNARIEIVNSTGIELFSPLVNVPTGFVGSSQLQVRLIYTTAGNTWQWVSYSASNPDARYLTAYAPVANVAAIPSGTNNARIEIVNSTGIELFSPLVNVPTGFVGSSQLQVRLIYTTTGNTWQWVSYSASNPDGRYVRQSSISDMVTIESSTTVASSTAVKIAKDAADLAQARAGRAPFLEIAKSAAGTSVSFTNVPTWVNRVTVSFASLSLSGAANLLIQLGDSGGFQTTGYISSANYVNGGAGADAVSSTAGIVVWAGSPNNFVTGSAVLTRLSGNNWIATGLQSFDNNAGVNGFFAGNKLLSGTLNSIRITSTASDTFDAGTINVMYE